MKMSVRLLALCPGFVLLALAVLLPAARSVAQSVPSYMAYQGYLADPNGNALGGTNGPVNCQVAFRLWNDPTAGSVVYGEQQTVTVWRGTFSAFLGQGGVYTPAGGGPADLQPAFATLFTNASVSGTGLYLQLTVLGGGGTAPFTLWPRLQISGSPCVFQAQNALQANAAVSAGSLVPTATNPPTVSVTDGTVNVATPLAVNGAMTASFLSVTQYPWSAGNDLTVNGNASVNALTVSNRAAVSSLQVTTALAAATCNVGGQVSAATLTAAAFSANTVSAATLTQGAGILQATALGAGTLAAGNLSSSGSLTANGSVMLDTGTYPLSAAGGDCSLKIIRGTFTNGVVNINASGFTCTIQSGPQYHIVFTKPFSAAPVVFATSINPLAQKSGDIFLPVLIELSSTDCTLMFVNKSNSGGKHYQDFHFLAMGPP